MHFIVSIVHPVPDLQAAVEFFSATLGFVVSNQTTEWALVDNGAIAIRLVAEPERDCVLHLNMETGDLEAALKVFESSEEVFVESAPEWVDFDRQEQTVRLPHGLRITLFRTFNEDELGILPELPTSLDWRAEASDRIRQLLGFVPIDFRDMARRRVTEQAESLALSAGGVTVDLPLALRALVEATPAFQTDRLRDELVRRGIDPEPLFERWG